MEPMVETNFDEAVAVPQSLEDRLQFVGGATAGLLNQHVAIALNGGKRHRRQLMMGRCNHDRISVDCQRLAPIGDGLSAGITRQGLAPLAITVTYGEDLMFGGRVSALGADDPTTDQH